MKVVLVAINAKYVHSNLALYSLQKSVSQYQEYLELAEYTINNEMDAIVRDLFMRQADVICFSCYVWNIEYVKDAARQLHKVSPNTKIWFGGPEVSYDGLGIFEQNPYLFGVMIGEGEATFAELMDFYCNSKNVDELSKIPGIMYRKNGEPCLNECRILCDLDQIPFVYDDLTPFENKIIYYESSRGCPFRCSYCMSSIDKTVRFRSLDLVFKELQFFLDHQVMQVKFIDRTFNIRIDRTLAILQYLKEHDNGITNFHFEVAADILCDEEIELINQLRPGYVQLEIGVQSTNEHTLREINRVMDFSKVAKMAQLLKKPNNVHVHLDLIAGLPFEDITIFRKSFNDVYALRPHELQLGFLKVLKGSLMHEKADEYQILYGDKAPYEVLSTKWMSFEDIIHLKDVEEMLEVYYNSGLFPHTMDYIVDYFEDAFALYDSLAEFYRKGGYNGIKHTRITRYRILEEFIESVLGMNIEIARDLLVFDLYSREDLKTRPEFAPIEEQLKENVYKATKAYALEHKGERFHVEPFHFDVLNYLENGEIKREEHMILFDYEKRHKVSMMAEAKEV